MIVPYEQLSAEALNTIIEDWLSRQSQDLTISYASRDNVIETVKAQLKSGRLLVTWDDESQTINLLDAETLRDHL